MKIQYEKKVITMRYLMELVYYACCLLTEIKTKQSKTEIKTKQSKTYVNYRPVGLGYYIVTGKIITSSNSQITSKVKFF